MPVLLAVLLIAVAGCHPSSGSLPHSGTTGVSGADKTFHFTIGPAGKISAPVVLDVRRGTNVKLLVDNRTAHRYRLRVVGPDGDGEALLVARAEQVGQANLVVDRVGRHVIRVYGGGGSTPVETYPLQVDK